MSRMLLLADGSITIQRVIELTFAHEDVRVTSVSDGRRAVQVLETEQPDVVLVDVDLPEMDGYSLAAHIRRMPRLKGVPILLLAGAFEPVDQARAREVGSDGVIMKPFEPQVVVTRVKELIDQRDRMAVPISRPVVDPPVPSAPVQTTPNVRSAPPPPEPPAAEAKPGRDSAFLRMAPRDRENEAPADAPVLETLELPTRPIWEGQSGSPVASSTSSPSLAPSFPQMVPVATPSLPSAPPAAPAPKVTLASAFTALLAAEQSSNPAAAPVVAMSEASIEDAVRRVLVRMTDDLVRRIVVDTAERLIREEIEKIKANPD
jgi:CheY-like chemotaxis protein